MAQVTDEFAEEKKQTERSRPLIDWTDDFEKRLVYHVVAGSVLTDFPDLIDAQLFGGEDPAAHTAGGPASIIVQAALDYYKRHKAAPGSQISDVIASLKRNKDLIPLVQDTWDSIVEHEAASPTLYEEMKVHLGARCLYRASRQKALAEAEWLARGEFETIEEWGEAQKGLLERIERIEKAGSIKTPYKLTRASDFVATPVEWLIDGLVPAGMLSMVAGKDGLGKSLLTMEMGKCVLTKRPFLGKFEIKRPGRVLMLLMDDPDSLISDRLIEMGIKDHPDLYVPQDIDYSNPIPLLQHTLKICMNGSPPSLIVVDCLYRLLPQKANSNNDSAQMSPLLNILNSVAEKTGAAVIVIHHENKKGGGDIAGSFAIRAALKTLIRISKPKPGKDEMEDDTLRVMGLEKSKLVREDFWTLHLNGVGRWALLQKGENGERISLLELKILEVLGQHPDGLTRSQIAQVMGMVGSNLKPFSTTLDAMVLRGAVDTQMVRRKDLHDRVMPMRVFMTQGAASPARTIDAKKSLREFYRGNKGKRADH